MAYCVPRSEASEDWQLKQEQISDVKNGLGRGSIDLIGSGILNSSYCSGARSKYYPEYVRLNGETKRSVMEAGS
ncbi:hypothetical protein KQX54_001823 [Cotesia glomerata]|uniref:Uncharacterized protein n=1 Tax=Cotesia glomerata TaxID=32391 RepID=A0AAV7I4L8_COTGL|nr:hypothetical protein KQX54_001823 [Cotesia glomerata]